MKTCFVLATLLISVVVKAGSFTIAIDTQSPARKVYADGTFRVGYCADVCIGDEAAALSCRRAGAWLFRSSQCDDATLEFCDRYALKMLVVLKGSQDDMVKTVKRLGKSRYKKVVVGVQLSEEPIEEKDVAMWRQIALLTSRELPKVPIAIAVKDLNVEIIARMGSALKYITHLSVDLREENAPYSRLDQIGKTLRGSQDDEISKLRLLAIGPGRLNAADDKKISSSNLLAWQMHWILAAFAIDRTDMVFVDRKYRADDYGLAMRHFWAVATKCVSIISHGEGATSDKSTQPLKKVSAPQSEMTLDIDSAEETIELSDAFTPALAPMACANIAAGKRGDVEYLVLMSGVDMDGERTLSLVVVNTSGEKATLKLNVNKNGGNVTSGWRRRLVPDKDSGKIKNSTRQRFGKPFSETVDDGEVTFIDFRI